MNIRLVDTSSSQVVSPHNAKIYRNEAYPHWIDRIGGRGVHSLGSEESKSH